MGTVEEVSECWGGLSAKGERRGAEEEKNVVVDVHRRCSLDHINETKFKGKKSKLKAKSATSVPAKPQSVTDFLNHIPTASNSRNECQAPFWPR